MNATMMPTVANARRDVCEAMAIPIEAISAEPTSAEPAIGKRRCQLSRRWVLKSSATRPFATRSKSWGPSVISSMALAMAASFASA